MLDSSTTSIALHGRRGDIISSYFTADSPMAAHAVPDLGLGVGNNDAKGLHAEGEARQAFHELSREQTDRLGLVCAPCCRGVVLIPLVELTRRQSVMISRDVVWRNRKVANY